MSIDLDHVLSRNAPKDGEPPVIVEPGDPYPYLYVELPDENAVVMAVGSVGFDPEWGEDRPPPEPSVITSVAPTSITAGTATPMTVTGTGFHDGDAVYQDEGMMPTTFVSATELTFTAQADAEGTVDITVHGVLGVSNGISVPVTGEESGSTAAVLSSVTPLTIATGATSTFTFTGTGFTDDCVVRLELVLTCPTIFVNDTTLTAEYTGATPGTYDFTVYNGKHSNAISFEVTAA